MSRFDWCAVDSADEDNPTPVDANTDNQRLLIATLMTDAWTRPQLGTLDLPPRFGWSALAKSDDD